MLVALELGLPRQTAQLKQEAAQIEDQHKAEKGTVRASIHYFRHKVDGKEVDGLAALKEVQNEYKRRVMTLARYPYASGWYLCPAGSVNDIMAVRQKFETGDQAELLAAYMKWADQDYPGLLSSAPLRMGSLYTPDDFPSLSDCAKRFKARLTVMALPEKEQIARITLISPEHQQLLKVHADETSKLAIAELHKSLWKDFMSPLQHIVDVFSKDKPKIYDSMIGNLMEIANVLPNYKELAADPELMDAAAKVKEVFGQMKTEDLRTSQEARDAAFTQAKDMVAKFKPFARKFTE